MAALIEAAAATDFPAEIVLVISNRADAGGLEKAAGCGIPTLVIESKPFGRDRAAFEGVLQTALDQHNIELICLGGIHAAVHRRLRAALVRPHAQYSPLAAAVVSRARAASAGTARRREDLGRNGAFRQLRKPTPARS